MGLFVRDECERSIKNQVSKDELVDFATSSWVAHEKQLASSSRETTREKAMCGAHDWKLKSHARLSDLRVFCEKNQLVKDPWNFLFGKKFCYFTKFFTHTINTLITHEL